MCGRIFQIYAIIKHNGAPVVATSGLTVEANTRRFVVDEKRELYYRAEVQNRVYKRELIEVGARMNMVYIDVEFVLVNIGKRLIWLQNYLTFFQHVFMNINYSTNMRYSSKQ